MAINFPSTSGQPTDGSYTHTVGNVTWSWDGSSWTASSNTGSGGGGGGIDLTNLSVTSNSVGTAALSYDNTSGVFTYTPPDLTGSGGGGIDLTNLSVTSNSVGTAALSYDNTSGVFTYTPPDLSGYALAAHSHTYALNDLSNVNVSAPITDGHILNWDNTNNEWVASGNINIDGNINLEGHIELGPVNATKISATDATLGHWNTVIENSTNGDIFIKGAELLLQANHTGVTKTWVHGNTDYSVDLYHDGDVALSTSEWGIQVEANSSSIPGLQGEVNVGSSGNCKVLAFRDNGNNSAEDNNTFKIYSQHGNTNTTKTSILYESFYDQVWRVKGEGGSGCSGISHAELGRINHDGGWELRYHDIQGTAPNWTGTTCDKKLETTAGGVDVTGDLAVTGSITLNGSAITGGGGGGGATALDGLSDVNVSASILLGDILTWDTTNTEWVSSSNIDINGNITATGNTHNLEGTLSVGGPAGNDNGVIKLSSRGFNITANSSGNGGSEAAGYTTYNTIIQSGNEDLFVNVDDSTRFIVRGSVSSSQGNQGTEELARFTPGAGVELMHDNSKKLETTTDGVTVTGKVTTFGIDSNGQYNIKPGGEFFKFENTSAWHLTFDKTGSSIGANWTYAINASKTSVKLYGGEESGNDNNASVKLQTKTTGVDITGALDVTGSITLNGSAITGGGTDTNDYVDAASLSGTDLVIGRTGTLADLTVDLSTLGGGGTLQQVTDLGSSTTNDITANKFSDTSGDVRSLSGVAHTAAYIITDRTYVGRLISTTANVTVNGAVLQIGDAITVYNNSASPISISQGSGVALILAGTNSGGNRSLIGTGIATILCIDSTGNNFVVTGTGVT